MQTRLDVGNDVFMHLTDPTFQAGWRQLYDECPWATGGQVLEFVLAWYESYRERFAPMVLSATHDDGTLAGVFPLALNTASGELTGAGGPQSEYQCWLARPDSSDEFIRLAMRSLQSSHPWHPLYLKYLPPGLPLDALRTHRTGMRHIMHSVPRPHVKIDIVEVEKSLGRRTNRNKMNRMRRMGEVRFEKITDPDALSSVLEEYIRQYDFRQAAMYNWAAFKRDASKKAFYQARLRHGLMHATVLSVGDAIASINLGQCDKNSVQLGISHLPTFAPHSPGRFHLYFLCRMLLEEGVEYFDLTPGGLYKETMANAEDEVHAFYACHTLQLLNRNHVKRQLTAQMLKVLPRLNISTTAVRLGIGKAKQALANAKSLVLNTRKTKSLLYQGSIRSVGDGALGFGVKRNGLDDLLNYEARGSGSSYQEFQLTAMRQLESGYHAYTSADHGRLNYCAWLRSPHDESPLPLNGISIPEGAAVVLDIYRHPQADGDAELHRFLAEVMDDAGRRCGTSNVCVLTRDSDREVCAILVSMGFLWLEPRENAASEALAPSPTADEIATVAVTENALPDGPKAKPA